MQVQKFSLILFMFTFMPCMAQDYVNSPIEEGLKPYMEKRHQISLKGTHALMAWSCASLATGVIGSASQDGSQLYFHQMNAFWGGVDLIVATASYATLRRDDNQPAVLPMARMDQIRTERIFLINAGLDALFVGGGIWLLNESYGQQSNSDRLRGYGSSIILQGSFLLVFDGLMFSLHRRNGKKRLKPFLENLSFNGSSIRFSLP